MVKYAEHIADLVGNTPLVKLNTVTEGIAATEWRRTSGVLPMRSTTESA